MPLAMPLLCDRAATWRPPLPAVLSTRRANSAQRIAIAAASSSAAFRPCNEPALFAEVRLSAAHKGVKHSSSPLPRWTS